MSVASAYLFCAFRIVSRLSYALIVLECVRGHGVQPQDALVGILDKDELAIFFLHDHVDNGADNAPSVCQIEIHLGRKITRLVTQDSEDNVVVG
jgi:hypothetical protein